MFTHRFREQLPPLAATGAFLGVGACCAFVSCPAFGGFSVAQQAQIQEIYRVAAERTREQMRQRRSRFPQFSVN